MRAEFRPTVLSDDLVGTVLRVGARSTETNGFDVSPDPRQVGRVAIQVNLGASALAELEVPIALNESHEAYEVRQCRAVNSAGHKPALSQCSQALHHVVRRSRVVLREVILRQQNF